MKPLILIWLCATLLSSGAPKPNILIICVDDMGFNDLGCYAFPHVFGETNPPPANPEPSAFAAPNQAIAIIEGKRISLTPNIDQLAATGITFTNYHAPAAICTPSRGGLLTGLIPARLGFSGAISPQDSYGLNTRETTLAEALKDQGYATVAIGKWHLGNKVQQLPTRHGFDRFWGITRSNNQNPDLFDQETSLGKITDHNQADLLDRMTKELLSFIEKNREQPFFAYFTPHAPHAPMIAHPDFVGSSTKLLGKRQFLTGKRSRKSQLVEQSAFHDVVHELDFRIGEIIAKLDQLALRENTLIVFTSDNGPWSNWPAAKKGQGGEIGSSYPFSGGKTSITEGGTRVPAILSFPKKIPSGVISNELISGLDWFPTFVLRCGGSLPDDRLIDGYDLWPFLQKIPNARSPRPYFHHIKTLKEGVVTTSNGRHKFYSGKKSLIDLSNDFAERKDVSDSEKSLTRDILNQIATTNRDLQKPQPGSQEFSEVELQIDAKIHPYLELKKGRTATVVIKLSHAPATEQQIAITPRSGSAKIQITPQQILLNKDNWKKGIAITLTAQAGLGTDYATLLLSPQHAIPAREIHLRASE